MIGNDVVDLAQRGVQPGAQHPRFDARVFGECERAELARGDAPASLRWVYWAAKEAAYKVAKKLDRSVVWAPSRFAVTLDSAGFGRVEHGGRSFALRVESTPEFVHALAHDGSAGAAAQRAGVGTLLGPDDDLSACARAFACAELAGVFGTAPAALSILKQGRIPVLWIAGAPASADLSLSHHGRFVAYACELGEAARAARLAS
jgi:phosphopantetheinyl transferase (holo-ACP synthase)